MTEIVFDLCDHTLTRSQTPICASALNMASAQWHPLQTACSPSWVHIGRLLINASHSQWHIHIHTHTLGFALRGHHVHACWCDHRGGRCWCWQRLTAFLQFCGRMTFHDNSLSCWETKKCFSVEFFLDSYSALHYSLSNWDPGWGDLRGEDRITQRRSQHQCSIDSGDSTTVKTPCMPHRHLRQTCGPQHGCACA